MIDNIIISYIGTGMFTADCRVCHMKHHLCRNVYVSDEDCKAAPMHVCDECIDEHDKIKLTASLMLL